MFVKNRFIERKKKGEEDIVGSAHVNVSSMGILRLSMSCLPVYVWSIALTVLPHKEERFLYVVYPQVWIPTSIIESDSG